ncbi:MAG: hypothetical protein ABIF92_02550 [archaeon]
MAGLECDICEKTFTEEDKGPKGEELQDGDNCPVKACKGILYKIPEVEQIEVEAGEEEEEEETEEV